MPLTEGGGYAGGSASDEAQDFVRETGLRVVSVNPQYRLGLFGSHSNIFVREK